MGAAGNTIGGHSLHLVCSHESTLGGAGGKEERKERRGGAIEESSPAQHGISGSHGNLRSTAMYRSYSLGLMSGSGREKN